MLGIAEANDYVKPNVYQGWCNLLCCGPEKELFPLLKKHGIAYSACRFDHYPLGHWQHLSSWAGGFLTDNSSKGEAAGTRFVDESKFGQYYKALYDKPEIHGVVLQLESAI